MTDRDLLKQALDALERGRHQIIGVLVQQDQDSAIEALRAALAQGEQEPVAVHKLIAWIIDECHVYPESADEKAFAQRLLAAILHPKSGYTAPPQREWQSLTDEEIEEGQKQSWVDQQAWQAAVWWAEDKLREKNS